MSKHAELRIALICYGGVSLAIYMHGITKELHKLVRASRAIDAASGPAADAVNPFLDAAGEPLDTEAIYFEVLRRFAVDGTRLSVGIDIIGGTSAGGINGVVLGKAIAENADQSQLKRLWIDEADMRNLVRAPRVGSPRLRTALAVIGKLATFWTARAPLKGDLMSRLLYQALADMDRAKAPGWNAEWGQAPETLIPPGGELSLFLTTTDLNGFDVAVPSAGGGIGQRDRCHAQAIEFTHDGRPGRAFDPKSTPTLAFAARATSAFPGAFEPVNPRAFPTEAGFPEGAAVDTGAFRFGYGENGRTADDAWFVDGGVLDNAPFDLVVDAISRRRAATEVHRRLIYIEPDPGCALEAPPADTNGGTAAKRRWAADTRKVLMGVRGRQSLIDELIRLRAMNEKIAQVGAIAEQQQVEVLDRIGDVLEAIWGDGQAAPQRNSSDIGEAVAAMPSFDPLVSKPAFLAVSKRMHAEAEAALGSTWNTYQRLKAEAVARCVADAIVNHFALPGESGTAVFIRSATASWLRRRPCWTAPDTTGLGEFLRDIDTPYRHRRMLFILAGLNELYTADGGPPRNDIDALKDQAWTQIEAILAAPTKAIEDMSASGALGFLLPDRLQGTAFDGDRFLAPEEFAGDHAEEFATLFEVFAAKIRGGLGDGGEPLWEAFARATAGWNEVHRVLLASRYLGFPLWDGLLFPTISLSDLPQFSQIPLVQFSPLRARALRPLKARKLDGVALHHFGAFMDAPYRENDYLWGRLDAVELILRTVREAVPGAVLESSHLPRALAAVLATEKDLATVPRQLRDELAAQIRALGGEDSPDALDLADAAAERVPDTGTLV
ncbi:patatin-like protein [Nocardia sp. NPDC005366]|uniref:patatin-like protein n=1 Tax=Nocardia sp. NPDC005366 TaxID=3156878 RepID=UPI0033BD6D96